MEKPSLVVSKSFAQSTRAAYKSFRGAYTKANTAIEQVAAAIIALDIADERGIATRLCEAVFGHKIDKSSADRDVSLQSQFFYNAYCKAFNKGAYAPKKPRTARQPDSTARQPDSTARQPDSSPKVISDGANVPNSESVQIGAARAGDIVSLLEAMNDDAFMSVLELVAVECALRSIDSAEFLTYYNKKASALESHIGKAPDKPRRNRVNKSA